MNSHSSKDSDPIADKIGIRKPSSGRKKILIWSVVAVLLIVAFALIRQYGFESRSPVRYQTAAAKQGRLAVTVTATGAIQPLNKVEVGSEVSGTVKTVLVDFNDTVKTGQVLALLDASKIEAQVLQSKAALDSARAELLQSQASVFEARSELNRLNHARELSGGRLPSLLELDAAQAALQKALADEAAAQAGITQAEAVLNEYESDVKKTVIRSPIDGIILERKVEPGQTVAASFETPVLFTLAEDLSRMELHVNVDEADIGQIREGQEADFSVDAYPDRYFKARIVQVRYASSTESGVVSYETVLSVDNPDMLLLPGMTATADIMVQDVADALLIPNAALRFSPAEPEEAKIEESRGFLSRLMPRPRRTQPKDKSAGSPDDPNMRRVWILKDNAPFPVSVSTGATDGSMTEIRSGEIHAGDLLIIDMEKS